MTMALSKEELLEGNKLICQFMGLVRHNESGHPYEYGYYHQQWNYLMDVVEKIETIHDDHHGFFGVYISSNSCSIQGTNLYKATEDLEGYGWVYMSDPNAVLDTKIESAWWNIVQFIKWYNTQSTQQ